MKHLGEAELVDLIEGRAGTEHSRHIATCAACRYEVASLRTVLDAARRDPVPEPSPIFWEQLSARISEAIDAGPAPSRRPWPLRTASWRLAAAAVAVLAAIVTWPFLRVERTVVSPAAPSELTTTAAAEPADVDGSVDAWDALEVAVEDFDWEEAQSIGIASRPGSAEPLVEELTDDERLELVRLIEEEIRRHGA